MSPLKLPTANEQFIIKIYESVVTFNKTSLSSITGQFYQHLGSIFVLFIAISRLQTIYDLMCLQFYQYDSIINYLTLGLLNGFANPLTYSFQNYISMTIFMST